MGFLAGNDNQGTGAVAIGDQAGITSQGSNAVAIGRLAGPTSQHANTIVLNASGSDLNTLGTSRFIAKPIRNDATGAVINSLCWDSTTGEIFTASGATTKTFVIQHPTDDNKHLVHACLEGPEAGVYYRGKDTLPKDGWCEVKLPSYARHVATDFTVMLTPVGSNINCGVLTATEVDNGKFIVYGTGGVKFNWLVMGERESIDVEVSKDEFSLCGDGPYTYLTKK